MLRAFWRTTTGRLASLDTLSNAAGFQQNVRSKGEFMP